MAHNIIDIKKYSPRPSDIFFFDNNVWMHIFGSIANFNIKKQKHYTSFLQEIRSRNCTIFINSLVVSEFTNRSLRLEFELWKKDEKKYNAEYKRDFVGTKRYIEATEMIKSTVNKILNMCEKSSDNFNAIPIASVFQHFEVIDFNDSYYIELARMCKWKIVTDDKDFIKYNNHQVEVITDL